MILAALCAPLLSFAQQQTLPVITLQQSIDAALSNGESWKILQGNLSVVRAQHAENISRNSFTLAGNAAGGYNYAVYDNPSFAASKIGSLSSVEGTQGASVGISLASPLTSVSVSATPWVPPIANTSGLAGYGDTTGGLGLSVSQVVWNGYPGGSTQAVVDKSLLNLRGQELSTESARLSLIYQVKQSYYTMFTALQDLQTRQQIFQRQNALLDQITAVYNLKQASEVDLKTAQINAHSAEIDVRASEHTLRLARIRLANIMAIPADPPFTVVQPPDEQLPAATLADAVSAALSRRVDMKLIQLNKRSNAIDIAVARGQATPTISVGGGASLFMDYYPSNPNNGWAGLVNAGVKVAMPVLDAGASQNLVDAGTRLDGIYTVQIRQLQKSIAADVQDAWEAMELQKERVELARQTAENDDLLVEVYKVQSRSGTASTQDLLTASVNAANAHTAFVQAQAAAQLAVLQLLSVMGY